MTHINDPSQSPGASPGGDDDLLRLEAEFADDFGGALAAFGAGAGEARFRDELRRSFVSGAIDGEIDEAAVLGNELERALRSVPVAAPRAEFRAAALESFLAGEAAAPAADSEAPTAVSTPAPRLAGPRRVGPRPSGRRGGGRRGEARAQGGGASACASSPGEDSSPPRRRRRSSSCKGRKRGPRPPGTPRRSPPSRRRRRAGPWTSQASTRSPRRSWPA